MIKSTVKEQSLFDHKSECLVIFCLEEKKPGGTLKEIDRALNEAIEEAFSNKRFGGMANQTLALNARGLMKTDNIILAGLGKGKELCEEKIRQAAGTAAKLAERSRYDKVSFALADSKLEKTLSVPRRSQYDPFTTAIAEGVYLSLYHFDQHKSQDEENPPPRIKEVVFLAPPKAKLPRVKNSIDRAETISQAVWATRDLILQPSNTATPTFLADAARKMARKHKITCRVLGKKEMQELKMGALLGVARGSREEPKFIILEYLKGKKKQAPVVIVGKGITFDTGGISLKPGPGMDEMKMDMSGGAVTIGALQAVASLGLPVNVVGLVPASENMPDGSAIKPGDVLKSMSGKTIEVLNTDAEGRLILADALTYAARYKPRAVIDLATLTGACVVALGSQACAVIGNHPRLIEKIRESGTVTGERAWELPLWEEYEKAMKSDIADLKNISAPKVGAGTITGAAFLKAFAGDQPWAHLDIAGTSWSSEEKPYIPKGASGFGVRLLLHYLEHNR